MISRRQFLEAGGLAAGVAAVSHRPLASWRALDEKPDESSLPPSIARLKSRRSEADPISREERHERQERARKLMSENALDAIVLMEGTSLRYFTGIRWWGGERMFALVLPAKGAAFYVCPAFEEGRAREQLANAPDGGSPDVRTWQEDESPYQRVSQGLTHAVSPAASWAWKKLCASSSWMELPKPLRKPRLPARRRSQQVAAWSRAHTSLRSCIWPIR